MEGVLASLKNRIYNKLYKVFEPEELIIIDDSKKHLHHLQSPKTEETHFSITMTSRLFLKLSRIERHQLVYQALEEELKTQIHALSLILKTPQKDVS